MVCLHRASAADRDRTGVMTLEEKLAKADPEFLQFLKDEGNRDMLGLAADDLSASSSDDDDDDDDNKDDDKAQQSAAKVNFYL